MKPHLVLITGGAGFIGSHLADALLAEGYGVRILDALVPQVHGLNRERPAYLAPAAELRVGDVRDTAIVRQALEQVETVIHFAAVVGVGQSMYEIASYVAANTQATANLLQILSERAHGVRKLVVASSMSLFGEGAYRCVRCGPCTPPPRSPQQLESKQWEMACPICGGTAEPVPTPEGKPLAPTSIYALTKRDQEEMCLCVGQAYGIPSVALRFFNVYGERQALSNPYTGVAAIFSSRLLNDQPPLIYEDGRQSRDFIHVSDIVQATLLAMRRPEADYQVFNVGTGRATTVAEVAEVLAASLGKKIVPQFLQSFRAGDIRHCVADITKISKTLGFQPKISFADGMGRLSAWIRNQRPHDGVVEANVRLRERGLVG
ncbi:MAG: NAD-dependent epimerase/dehydratase family protein [Nitrospirae bacterium]|nr:NAD-dependent epimerase/dehydratase family protein [Nitrospirota bacterium]